jgi:hypothetical protein
MAGNFSNYLEEAVLNHVFGATTLSKPSLFLALFTSATDDAAGGSEVSGNAYARQSIAFAAAANPAGTIANSGVVTFPVATPSGWGTITDFAIYDAATVGNRLVWGTLTASKTVGAGDRIEFAVGALVITLD